jgi:hypothetical protein
VLRNKTRKRTRKRLPDIKKRGLGEKKRRDGEKGQSLVMVKRESW